MNNRVAVIVVIAVCMIALHAEARISVLFGAQRDAGEPHHAAKSDPSELGPPAVSVSTGDAVVNIRDASSGGMTVTDRKINASVGQSVSVSEGETVDSVTTVFGSSTISGHVTGDVVAVLGDIRLKPTAVVDGDVMSVGGRVIRDPVASVGGSDRSVGVDARQWLLPSMALPTLFGVIRVFVASVLLALLMAIVVALFPARMDYIAATALERPGMSALYGAIALLLVFPVAVVLVVTFNCVSFLPIGLELIFIWLASFVGNTGICLALGRRISQTAGQPISAPVPAVILGRVVTGFAYMIPVLGTLIGYSLGVVGLGAVLLTRFGLAPAISSPSSQPGGPASAMPDGEGA